jgi:hypothetical protein
MTLLYDGIRLLHVLAGVLALALFWVPALTRKGGRTHRAAGRVYVRAMSVVVATGVPLSLAFALRGEWVVGTFLGYLSVITFTALWSGRRVLDYKPDAAAFRTRGHAALGVLNVLAAVAVLALAWTAAPAGFIRVLFTAFSIIGFAAAWETVRFFRRPPIDRRWWWYEHFGGMIGSGIAAHTAFGVFGVRQLFPELQLGPWGLVPWLAPSIVGTIAIVLLNRHYRRRFSADAAPARASVDVTGERRAATRESIPTRSAGS